MAQFNFWPFGTFDLSAMQVHNTMGSAKPIGIMYPQFIAPWKYRRTVEIHDKNELLV